MEHIVRVGYWDGDAFTGTFLEVEGELVGSHVRKLGPYAGVEYRVYKVGADAYRVYVHDWDGAEGWGGGYVAPILDDEAAGIAPIRMRPEPYSGEELRSRFGFVAAELE